jgi:hypothetical protein
MQLRQKYLKIVSGLVAAGAVGTSALLGSTLPAASNERPADVQSSGSQEANVSERLAAIREAVFATVEPESGPLKDENIQLAWGNRWGNLGWGRRPGWGRPRWNNWRNGWPNWHNGWRNW